MNALLNLGRYMFAIPFAIFGVFHFMNAEGMAGMAFGSKILVYLTGIALIAAAISIIIGKLDKLAGLLLGIYLLLTAFIVHLPGAMEGDASMFLKDFALAGGAWMFSAYAAKDSTALS